MELRGDDGLRFREERQHSRPGRVALYLALIAAALWVLHLVNQGVIQPMDLFAPTPTPTRTARSWAEEGAAQFVAGNLEAAIEAYRQALTLDPNNAHVWAELARIQTYSSALLPTDTETYARLQEALASANKAADLAPDDPFVHAIRAFVLDWTATAALTPADQRAALLTEAQNAASRALLLAPNDPLALAFFAEVLLDQNKWNQAEQYAERAVQLGPHLMDTHRVYAFVQEALGRYNTAIRAYQEAVKLAPNLTFLYIRLGIEYRTLASRATLPDLRDQYYQMALDYFATAANINARLGIKDPTPYVAIAKTYAQQGEFFIASRNAEKALLLDPTNPNTYAELGIIYIKARNYEGAVPVLKCAVEGCNPAKVQAILDDLRSRFEGFDDVQPVAVDPLPLTNTTVAFYYASYASVLAALDRCDQALPVMDRVDAAYPNDPVLQGISRENRAICRTLAEQKAARTPQPTAVTATPTPTSTSAPTPTP
ncbi:MAG TPA: tetratricopeptide repeat protein [Anaerolineae bacterium]|nr:tetratricopeptide repeat protein [Anaerolineae bacterium]HID84897.1 tetratricopeptide repeat protein [Anaerolineales bacterium]HIQ07931.1 tetratricopeptide repeat protein [Anaerolineaceae bacterium]